MQSPLGLVSAMITPGILILASGSLITSTLTRLARVVDRTRTVIAMIDEAVAQNDMRLAQKYAHWLDTLSKRSVVIERSLQIYYISIAMFVSSTLAIALSDLVRHLLWLTPTLVISGIFFLLMGTAALIWETNLSAGTIRGEIDASNALHRKAVAEALDSTPAQKFATSRMDSEG